MGQPLVIDNRSGSGGMVGAERWPRRSPTATRSLWSGRAITAAPSLTPGLSFDTLKDFTPVCLLVSTPLLLVTNTASPYRTLAQYVADAKAKPGQISIASGGNGTIGHLLAEQLQVDAGLKLIHVPYKGGAPALNDVIAGHVPAFFDTLTTSAKLVQEDKLRALGIVSAQRSPALPDVPTFAELGHGDISGSTWFAIIAPAGTPREVVVKLNEEANKALSLPDIRERIASLGGNGGRRPAKCPRGSDAKRSAEMVQAHSRTRHHRAVTVRGRPCSDACADAMTPYPRTKRWPATSRASERRWSSAS